MRAQLTLTVSEAKKLIAKAVVKLQIFQDALSNGVIVIHPSTTTSFIIEELYGSFPDPPFVCGMITPRGACGSKEMAEKLSKGEIKAPRDFLPWVIKSGKLHKNIKLGDVLREMDANDVYIKTGNAIDPNGHVGVLIGSAEGGTIGLAYSICAAKGINLIIPIGLEKMIPIPIEKASLEAGIDKVEYSMGVPVGLLPINGIVITEVKAIEILSRVSAIPIAAGGLMGAEGATTIIIKGERKNVEEAIKIVESIKGTKIPPITLPECSQCEWPPTCHFRKRLN